MKLGAEFSELDDRVLKGLSDQTIKWKRAGIPIAEEIAQITYAGSPSQHLDPQQVFKSFADSEQQRRKWKRESRLEKQKAWLTFFGGAGVASVLIWLVNKLL